MTSATTQTRLTPERYLELIAAKNPKEAEIVRKHITDLGGKPKK